MEIRNDMPVHSRILEKLYFFKNFSIQEFSKIHPYQYLLVTFLLAFIGFIYLLLFPAGVILGVQNAYAALLPGINASSLSDYAIWSSFTILSLSITYQIISIRFADPDGIDLTKQNAARLVQLVRDIEQNYRWPRIHKIVLSSKYEIRVVKKPLFGLPIGSKNILIVGFPLLQSTTPENFHCLLTHKLNQYSINNNLLFNWLSGLRDIWSQFSPAFHARDKLGDQLIYGFFKPYSAFYDRLSLFVAQQDILNGDDLALNQLNDGDYFKAVEEYYLCKQFLNNFYWPHIKQLTNKNSNHPEKIKPFSMLPGAIKKASTESNTQRWLSHLSHEQINIKDCDPGFSVRMANIGYTNTIPLDNNVTSVAEFLFNDKYKDVVEFMDKIWLQNAMIQQKRRCNIKPKSTNNETTTKLGVA